MRGIVDGSSKEFVQDFHKSHERNVQWHCTFCQDSLFCPMNTDLVRLAKNLKTARTAKGVTQPAAATAVGKTRQTIVNWENPENPAEPSSSELSTLAALYGVTPLDLRFGYLERGPAVVQRVAEGVPARELDAQLAAETGARLPPKRPSATQQLADEDRRNAKPAAKQAGSRKRK